MDEQIIKEWDDLSFYYEYDDDLKQWRFIGSKDGLFKLPQLISDFANDEINGKLSEHIHIGPYSYLKIMTWNEAIVTDNYIAGTPDDLIRLGKLIANSIKVTPVGNIVKIKTEYSETSTSSLLFIIMSDAFSPSAVEFDF